LLGRFLFWPLAYQVQKGLNSFHKTSKQK